MKPNSWRGGLRSAISTSRSAALKHFNTLAEIAPTRTEQARAHYWIGRTMEALGEKASATSHYREAAQHTTIYYGQLAREKLGRGKVPEEIDSGEASKAARAKIDNDDVVRAFKMVAETGRKNDLHMFLWSFANRFKTTDEMNAVANVVWGEGGAFLSVKLAKAAAAKNIDIDSWSYPIRALPEWKQIGRPVERALVFGLARQESEFNPSAGSSVGAQGLMQIMPATAKIIARQHKVGYAPGKLTSDPAYNVKLGAAHLGDLVADNGGSYVLDARWLQRRPAPGPRMGCRIWRSARRQGRSHRLGGIDPLPGNPAICAESLAEHPCLSLAAGAQDRGADEL